MGASLELGAWNFSHASSFVRDLFYGTLPASYPTPTRGKTLVLPSTRPRATPTLPLPLNSNHGKKTVLKPDTHSRTWTKPAPHPPHSPPPRRNPDRNRKIPDKIFSNPARFPKKPARFFKNPPESPPDPAGFPRNHARLRPDPAGYGKKRARLFGNPPRSPPKAAQPPGNLACLSTNLARTRQNQAGLSPDSP